MNPRTNPHTPEHEPWLEALALDERQRIPEALRAAVEACAICRTRAEEFRSTRALVDELAGEMRTDLAAAAQLDAGELGRRSAAQVARLAGRAPAAARGRPRRLLYALAALAASIAVFGAGWYFARSEAPRRAPEFLNAGGVTDMVARVEGERVFVSWRVEAPLDEIVEIEVRYRNAAGLPIEFKSDPLTDARTWNFARERLTDSAESFEWRVVRLPSSGYPLPSPWTRVELTPR
jgi:hypothetical protein